MATNSLPQSTFQPISASAVQVLARLAARTAVKDQLRADGVRVSLVPPAGINIKATAFLALHPELYDEARERPVRMGMFEKPKRRRKSAVLVTPMPPCSPDRRPQNAD